MEVNGNKAKASRQLGISRTQLYMRLRKHGLEREPSLDSLIVISATNRVPATRRGTRC